MSWLADLSSTLSSLTAAVPLLVQRLRPRDSDEAVLILGDAQVARELCRQILHGSRNGDGAEASVEALETAPDDRRRIQLDAARFRRLVVDERITRIVVTDPRVEYGDELAEALVQCRFEGVRVMEGVDFYEQLHQKLWIDVLDPEWLVFSDGFRHSRRYRAMKRALDVVFALLTLGLAAPLMALIAVAIKLDSPGSVLFKQERVGLHGEIFQLYKFRSMRENAEEETGPVWAQSDDDRVTRVGRVLRKFHLDELPQVINVLRNELSFVGPRPERPCFVEELRTLIPYYDLRHLMKPGITGWAQVSYEYGDSVEDAHEKLEYDLFYAKHAAVPLDLRILLKTVQKVTVGTGR